MLAGNSRLENYQKQPPPAENAHDFTFHKATTEQRAEVVPRNPLQERDPNRGQARPGAQPGGSLRLGAQQAQNDPRKSMSSVLQEKRQSQHGESQLQSAVGRRSLLSKEPAARKEEPRNNFYQEAPLGNQYADDFDMQELHDGDKENLNRLARQA